LQFYSTHCCLPYSHKLPYLFRLFSNKLIYFPQTKDYRLCDVGYFLERSDLECCVNLDILCAWISTECVWSTIEWNWIYKSIRVLTNIWVALLNKWLRGIPPYCKREYREQWIKSGFCLFLGSGSSENEGSKLENVIIFKFWFERVAKTKGWVWKIDNFEVLIRKISENELNKIESTKNWSFDSKN
jgi:hypothetical protein